MLNQLLLAWKDELERLTPRSPTEDLPEKFVNEKLAPIVQQPAVLRVMDGIRSGDTWQQLRSRIETARVVEVQELRYGKHRDEKFSRGCLTRTLARAAETVCKDNGAKPKLLAAKYKNRAEWLQRTLDARHLTALKVYELHGKPSTNTIKRILKGEPVNENTLQALVDVLQVHPRDIPAD